LAQAILAQGLFDGRSLCLTTPGRQRVRAPSRGAWSMSARAVDLPAKAVDLPEEESEEGTEDEDEGGQPFSRQRTPQSRRGVLSVDVSAVFLVYIVNFLDSLGGSISTPILPFYAKEFNATYAEVGQLFSVFALAQMASMPFLSYASDLYGRRAVLLMATFGSGLGAIWQGTATSYTSLLVSRTFSGAWSGVASVCQVYLVDVVPADLRADYMSYLNSSTQASVLFGPSIGAGLSALGLQAPFYVQSAVCFILNLIVWAHLPESPEWCRLNAPASPASQVNGVRSQRKPTRNVGVGKSATYKIIAGYGVLSFCGMVAQMAIMSMFAIYAERTYHLDSVRVGFTMTLGAISSVGTNIWVSPPLLRLMGESSASLLGFALIICGSMMVTLQSFALSVLGFMLAYQGLAINSSAVATGAANMTDSTTRATIMTGTRMLKSLGAVVGPIISGHLAAHNVCWPFFAAAGISMVGLVAQNVLTLPLMKYVKDLLEKRKTVGRATSFLEGEWIDEHGTQEEIWDLGVYVANLLTSRHYRWVTYNRELKNFLSDSFPPMATGSEEAHRRTYDSRRKIVREQSNLTYEQLRNENNRLMTENKDLQRRLKMVEGTGMRGRSKSREQEEDNRERTLTCQQMMPNMPGFGGP